MFVFLYLHFGIWIWSDYRKSRCQFLDFSLLDGCFLPQFLFPLCSSEYYCLWLSRESPSSLGVGLLMVWMAPCPAGDHSPSLGLEFWLCMCMAFWLGWEPLGSDAGLDSGRVEGFCLIFRELTGSLWGLGCHLASGDQDCCLAPELWPWICCEKRRDCCSYSETASRIRGSITWFSGCCPGMWGKRRLPA